MLRPMMRLSAIGLDIIHSFIAGVAVRRLAEIVLIAGTTICDAILVRLLKREATSIVEVERGLIELSMS